MRFGTFVFSILMLLFFQPQAKAALYDINLNGIGTSGGFVGPCYCDAVNAYASPIFKFGAGDTVNFGSVTTSPIFAAVPPDVACCYTGPPLPDTYIVFSVYENTNPLKSPIDPFSTFGFGGFNVTSCDPGVPCVPPVTTELLYSFNVTTNVQIGWVNGTYTPPVPEPSTWAMLLIGVAAIGVAARRRRQKLYPLVALC
jgi:hypothetical protein